MWAIRLLSGTYKGRIIPLTKPVNTIGRAQDADICLPSVGVSKSHARLELLGDKIIITDLDSRNGTFVNGTKVKMQSVQAGDKILLHDTMIELVPASMVMQMAQPNVLPPQANLPNQMGPAPDQPPVNFHSGPAVEQMGLPEATNDPIDKIRKSLADYIDNVAMPGIYKLAEMMEFRWALGLIFSVFIVVVTALAAIPSINLLKSGVEQESQQNATTIAETLANINQDALNKGLHTGVTVGYAQRKMGVKEAFIISAVDGSIIAPARLADTTPKKYPFIHTARRTGKKAVKQIDDSTIISMVPVSTYNPQTQTRSPRAYAVVIYDMGSLAVDEAQVLSLFVQILAISLILGALFFIIIFKMITHPIESLNLQIDSALREGRDDLHVEYNFPALKQLVSNINSSLTRAHQAPSDIEDGSIDYDRGPEIINLTQLVGFPAIAVDAENKSILAVNAGFEERLGISSDNLLYQPIESITDQALKLSVIDLLSQAESYPDQMATHQLEFSGINFEIACQSIFGKSNVSYYLVVLLPTEEAEAV